MMIMFQDFCIENSYGFVERQVKDLENNIIVLYFSSIGIGR